MGRRVPASEHSEDRPERPVTARADQPTSALREIARVVGNRAFTQHVRALQPVVAREPAAEGALEFSDDPLTGAGGSPATRPGAVRTSFIRLKNKQGASFNSGGEKDPIAWTKSFLKFFGFRPNLGLGLHETFQFNDGSRDLTYVLDMVEQEAMIDGVYLERKTALAVATELLPPGAAGFAKDRVGIYLSFSFARATHITAGTGQRGPPDPAGVQGAIQATWEVHPDGKPGLELSWTGQVGVAPDAGSANKKFELQSILTGPQAAYVWPFLDGSLQVGPLAQALMGVQRVQHADGIMRLAPTAQVAVGGQMSYVVPGTGQHLQIGGQAAASFTDPARSDPTYDYGYQLFLQWKF